VIGDGHSPLTIHHYLFDFLNKFISKNKPENAKYIKKKASNLFEFFMTCFRYISVNNKR